MVPSSNSRMRRVRRLLSIAILAAVLFSSSSIEVQQVDGFLTSSSPPKRTTTCRSGVGNAHSSHKQRLLHRRGNRPLFVMSQMSSSSSSSSSSSEPLKNRTELSASPIHIYNTSQVIETLWKYVHKLRKERDNKQEVTITRTAGALAKYMHDHPILLIEDEAAHHRLVNVTEAAMIPALRIAGQQNNYRLILQLVSNSIVFANQHSLLTSRVLGEAMHALAATQANKAKLASLWKLATTTDDQNQNDTPNFRAEPLTTYELNLYLKALASRGKSRACVDVFRHHVQGADNDSHTIVPDAYTISTLFSILTESVDKNQKESDAVTVSLDDTTGTLDLHRRLATLTSSTCWQWHAAVSILGMLPSNNDMLTTSSSLTNHVYSALLKLHVRAQKEFGDGHGNASAITMAILDDMMQRGVTPDAVMCTLAIMAMGQMDKASTSLGEDGEERQNLAVDFLHQMQSDPRLPSPNRYSYSAAIMACARQKKYRTAVSLLEEMRTLGTNDTSLAPNTLCYNQVLLSLDASLSKSSTLWMTTRKFRQLAKQQQEEEQEERTALALLLLDQMVVDSECFHLDTKPDVVTYNTILSVGKFPHQITNQTSPIAALDLLDEMERRNIDCDATTYRNAIYASTGSSETLAVLHRCISNDDFARKSKGSRNSNADLTAIFNAGLATIVSEKDLPKFETIISMMTDNRVTMDSDTLTAVLDMIEKTSGEKDCAMLQNAVEVLDGKSQEKLSPTREKRSENEQIQGDDGDIARFLRFLSQFSLPSLQDTHFTHAIKFCLQSGDLSTAFNILTLMRDRGFQPSTGCMEGFATAYAKAATSIAKQNEKGAASRANRAYEIAMALKMPRTSALGLVARACAVTGQWKQARRLLRISHTNLLKSGTDGGAPLLQRELNSVKKTHSILLRECAVQGNLNAAMFYTNDIQDFAKKYRNSRNSEFAEDAGVEDPPHVNDIFSSIRALTNTSSPSSNLGMRAQDWLSLIQAASKAGDWRVSFNSLQFLEPYVARTNPQKIISAGKEDDVIDQRYEQLAPALTAVVRCLESHEQEAWSSRCIKDWIEWSGRKPRAEAVLSAVRILATKGLGDEAKELIQKCLKKDLGSCSTKKGVGYEEMIFIGAVTSLHHNGLYDDADEIFMSGISSGHLPFDFARNEKGENTLDLHGLNIALSHSAVRIAMRQHAAQFDSGANTSDMTIVTGRGRNSAIPLRPILRPEVQRMLMEEFYPPLNTLSVAGNIGALQVLGQDIQAWQQHQQEQKGARMLELADLLRNISDQERIKRSIFASIRAIERDRNNNEPH